MESISYPATPEKSFRVAETSRRYLSLWLRRLSTDRVTKESRRDFDSPLALVGSVKNARLLIAVNDAAAKAGLCVGMSFADAHAIFPSLLTAEASPEEDARLLAAIADWCERYTPLVGLNPPDGLIFDITGCAHLFGGEAALARDILKRLSAYGFSARIGIADSVGAAWAVAHHGKTPIIPLGATHEALAPLPIAALRLQLEIQRGLIQLGLKTVGDIMARPRAPFTARFGAELMQRLDQALGREEEPITPRAPLPVLSVEQGFPEPLLRDEDLLATLGRLLDRLCPLLEQRGQGARHLRASFFAVDGKVYRLELGLSQPLRERTRLNRLFTDKFRLVQWDNEFGFDRIRLAVLEGESVIAAQKDFTEGEDGPALVHLTDRLSARLGAGRVLRLIPQDTHVPEHASLGIPAMSAKEFAPASHDPSRKSSRVKRVKGFVPPFSRDGDEHHDSLSAPRPLRLFERPEPIEAIAEIPDGPPVKFRWRRVVHSIAHAEGPERIAMPWWRDAPSPERRREVTLIRDYFRVETATGARFWLYREGLYGGPSHPRWFLHGMMP